MNHMKKILAVVLIVMSLFAIALPALAAIPSPPAMRCGGCGYYGVPGVLRAWQNDNGSYGWMVICRVTGCGYQTRIDGFYV